MLAMARAQGFECYALSVDYGSAITPSWRPRSVAKALVHATSRRQHRSDRLRRIGADRCQDCRAGARQQRHSDHLCSGAQYHHAVAGAGLGRGIQGTGYFHRRERGGLLRLPGLPPRISSRRSSGWRICAQAGVEGQPLTLHAPLLHLSKAVIRAGVQLGVDYGITVSCYQADEQGRACGRCDSCRLRHDGFEAAGVPDSTRYQVA